MIFKYPQKNAKSVQSKYSTLNSPKPDSKYRNYVSQANDTNKKISLQRNLAWPNQSQTTETYKIDNYSLKNMWSFCHFFGNKIPPSVHVTGLLVPNKS